MFYESNETPYVKLLDVYTAETEDTVSTFKDIGYEMSETNSFIYTDKISTKAALVAAAEAGCFE